MINICKQPCDEGVIRSKRCIAPVRQSGPWVLAATILGSSMSFIDGTVVNVALPSLQETFNATAANVLWVVQSYALFLSALILVGGALGDAFGRKRIFMIGVVIFAASSLWCGLSTSLLELIIARALQGIGGSLLVPGSLAIISASFDEDKRGQAIGVWSGFTSITSAIGPVLGGWLVQYASWRWVFFINIPLAIAVLTLTIWHVPESRGTTGKVHLDWIGAVLVTLALAGIVYGLTEASAQGFGTFQVLGPLVGGIVALIIFLIVEARSRNPMVPLTLFRSRSFSGANLLTLLLYAGLGGALYYLPFYLIQVQGYPAMAAGSALLPFVLLNFSLSRWAGGLVKRYGAKLPLVVGPVIAGCGFALFALPGLGGSYWTTVFPAVVVLGLGMSISIAPLTTTVLNSVDEQHSGVASGINNAVSRTASLLALAAFSIVMVAIFSASLSSQLDALPLPEAVRQYILNQQAKLAAITPPPSLSPQMQDAVINAVHLSFLNGYRVIMLSSAVLALLSALIAWVLIDSQSTQGKATTQRNPSATSSIATPQQSGNPAPEL